MHQPLTLSQARCRFAVSAVGCEAALNVLVEAGVLKRTSQGEYVRLFPRSTGRTAV
jgi:hypothetical protein